MRDMEGDCDESESSDDPAAERNRHAKFWQVTRSSACSSPCIQVAQLAPEERRMMRERWEQASRKIAMEIRRRFRTSATTLARRTRSAAAGNWKNARSGNSAGATPTPA